MNFIKILDNLYNNLENNKKAIISSIVSKDMYMLAHKLKSQLSGLILELKLSREERNLLSQYFKDNVSSDEPFFTCDSCNRKFPKKLVFPISNTLGTDIACCPACILSSNLHECHECHKIFIIN